jgi:hypothetical protein
LHASHLVAAPAQRGALLSGAASAPEAARPVGAAAPWQAVHRPCSPSRHSSSSHNSSRSSEGHRCRWMCASGRAGEPRLRPSLAPARRRAPQDTTPRPASPPVHSQQRRAPQDTTPRPASPPVHSQQRRAPCAACQACVRAHAHSGAALRASAVRSLRRSMAALLALFTAESRRVRPGGRGTWGCCDQGVGGFTQHGPGNGARRQGGPLPPAAPAPPPRPVRPACGVRLSGAGAARAAG